MTFMLAGVMGWPISHSLSPRLHGFWLREHAISGAYLPLAVSAEQLRPAIAGLSALGFRGCNVTVPHKEAVMLLMDEVSETARRIRAVNTVVVREDGRLFGDSSDGPGFLQALNEEAPSWPHERPAVVLGAGGAARAVVDALHQAGVTEIRVINRTPAKAERLAGDLGLNLRVYTWGQASLALVGAGLLVNTTSLGMTGQPELRLDLDGLPLDAVVFDIVYKPLETALLKRAALRGHPCVGGLGMLMHQAVPGFAAWFGTTPRVTVDLRAHLLEALT
jgi:shikimate dehydrogenase